MGDVVGITDMQAHMSGEAKCLACEHEWVAVSPVGSVTLECPECGTWKGVFVSLAMPEYVHVCKCGCIHFFIGSHDGEFPNATDVFCAKCGEEQDMIIT